MIARFFNTSKPIHSVIISVFILIIFVLSRQAEILSDINALLVLKEVCKYLVILLSVFVLDFLVNKNKLTQKNGYEILIYSLLLASFPESMKNTNVFMANLFIVFALRRIISLRSNLNIKKKLFDAAFWISIAALFHFWSFLFLTLVLAALILYMIPHFKNWMIPLVGIFTVIALVITYHIIEDSTIDVIERYIMGFEIGFDQYSQKIIIPLSIILALSLVAIVRYLASLGVKQKAQRASFVLIFIAFIIGVIIIILSPSKNSSELLFVFPSLTIIISNYLESISKRWLAEIYLSLLIIAPIAMLML